MLHPTEKEGESPEVPPSTLAPAENLEDGELETFHCDSPCFGHIRGYT